MASCHCTCWDTVDIEQLRRTGVLDIFGGVLIFSGLVALLRFLGPLDGLPLRELSPAITVAMLAAGIVLIAVGQIGSSVRSRQSVTEADIDEEAESEG